MKSTWLQRTVVIAFTIITGLLLGFIVFLGRESFLTGSMMLSKNAYLPRALDKVYLVVFGIVWLISWFVFEAYLNSGIAHKNVVARFLRLLGWELVALFAFSILAYWYTSSGINWTAVGLLSAALVAGVVLLLVARRLFAAPHEI